MTQMVAITALLPGSPRLVAKLVGPESYGSAAGGWQTVKRKLREPVLVWTERPLRTMSLPLRFDGYSDGEMRRVDGDARALDDWGTSGYRAGGEHNPPTLVRIAAVQGTLRHFATGITSATKWAITKLDWGEFITDDAGRRVQQDVTVELTQYTPVDEKGYAAALREALGETDDDGDDDEDDDE